VLFPLTACHVARCFHLRLGAGIRRSVNNALCQPPQTSAVALLSSTATPNPTFPLAVEQTCCNAHFALSRGRPVAGTSARICDRRTGGLRFLFTFCDAARTRAVCSYRYFFLPVPSTGSWFNVACCCAFPAILMGWPFSLRLFAVSVVVPTGGWTRGGAFMNRWRRIGVPLAGHGTFTQTLHFCNLQHRALCGTLQHTIVEALYTRTGLHNATRVQYTYRGAHPAPTAARACPSFPLRLQRSAAPARQRRTFAGTYPLRGWRKALHKAFQQTCGTRYVYRSTTIAV